MRLKIEPGNLAWWFWAVTLVFIVAAVGGWPSGYYVVPVISGLQLVYFFMKERSAAAFPVQIRIVYYALTLFGFWPGVRFWIYALLLLGTVMVTLFGRCAIALLLAPMPWNRGREVRLD